MWKSELLAPEIDAHRKLGMGPLTNEVPGYLLLSFDNA